MTRRRRGGIGATAVAAAAFGQLLLDFGQRSPVASRAPAPSAARPPRAPPAPASRQAGTPWRQFRRLRRLGRRAQRCRHRHRLASARAPSGATSGDGPQFGPEGSISVVAAGRRLVGRESCASARQAVLRRIAVFDDPPDRSQYLFHRRFALSAACRCHRHIRRPCDQIRSASSPKTRDESTTQRSGLDRRESPSKRSADFNRLRATTRRGDWRRATPMATVDVQRARRLMSAT